MEEQKETSPHGEISWMCDNDQILRTSVNEFLQRNHSIYICSVLYRSIYAHKQHTWEMKLVRLWYAAAPHTSSYPEKRTTKNNKMPIQRVTRTYSNRCLSQYNYGPLFLLIVFFLSSPHIHKYISNYLLLIKLKPTISMKLIYYSRFSANLFELCSFDCELLRNVFYKNSFNCRDDYNAKQFIGAIFFKRACSRLAFLTSFGLFVFTIYPEVFSK